MLPTRTSVEVNFKDILIGTVSEYHVYVIRKFSHNQIPNSSKNLRIGTQNDQTRNRSLKIKNLAIENDG